MNEEVKHWLDEVTAAKRREKDFRKDGQKINDIYENEENTPFNILYSNTEVLSPAIYSETPRPVIKRRFNDEDPLGRSVSEAGKRMLEYLVDTNVEGYEKFDDSIRTAVLDGLLPGRGVTAVKYDDETKNGKIEWASVCTDSKKWNRVYFGYALKWSKVPWVCYEDYLDEDEANELFGEKSGLIKFTAGEEEDEDENEGTGGRDDIDSKGQRKTALIYQIWDKSDKTVKYCSPECDEMLLEQDDPLSISGFFNCPKPLRFVRKANNLKPTALYKFYENQARELNRLTLRLNNVIEAIKAKGLVDGMLLDDLNKLYDTDEDGVLFPTENASSLSDKALKDRIWFMPLAELMSVAQQLYTAREACKRVIYEITGVSDIIRGQSMASETLGAQKIKEAWGTMRLKNMQKDAQAYARDTLRIMLDVAAQKLPERFWAKITALPFTTEEQRAKAEKDMKMAQTQLQKLQQPLQALQAQMQQQMQQDMQQVPQEAQQEAGQKAQQFMQQELQKAQQQVKPQLDKLQQGMQQIEAELQKPQWKDVLKVLKNDFMRSYKIDIETNSTLDVEATEDKQLVGDFMNAMAQFMNGMAPLIADGTMPFGAAKSMLLAITRRYRFGNDVEDEIKAMQEPQKQDPKQMQKAQQEMQKKEQKFQEEQKRVGAEFDKKAQELQQKEQELQFKEKMADQELKFNQKMAEMKIDAEKKEAQMELKMMLETHKSDTKSTVQSMLDKHKSHIEQIALKTEAKESSEPKESKPPTINITNQMPDGNKSIKIERENGQISGASIDG